MPGINTKKKTRIQYYNKKHISDIFLQQNFHSSLGLAIPPRIRFLKRMQKKTLVNNSDKNEEAIDKVLVNSATVSETENNENSSDANSIPDISKNEEKGIVKEKNTIAFQSGKQGKESVLLNMIISVI